jgi:hypothetical protein
MIKDTGYVALQIKGLTKSYKSFPAIASLNLTGTAVNSDTRFVRNNDGNFYHWGRRGPSVHLSYNVSKKINASWYYNEVTIPKNNDVIGSYYMAIGFNEGYFGIQVNSETERRILFSVWSPSNTDDPKSVPKSSQVQLLAKGNDVYTGEFGGEGSGGQSYLKYNWTAGTTYKFLVHGVPGADKTTTYTAYFCPSNGDKWQLIASFKRPLTQTYLKGFYSFLENFAPEGGAITRSVLFDNQWVCNDKGNWIEINACRFTTDDTGNKKYRMDYAGGLSGNQFYLKNCGFFNKFSLPGTVFTRILTNNKPLVDFDQLP